MAFIKSRFVWLMIVGIFIWLLIQSFHIGGSDPLLAQSSALAMQGYNMGSILLAHAKSFPNDIQAFNSSESYLRHILSRLPEKDEQMAFDNEGCLWNVFADSLASDDGRIPILISANFNPRILSHIGAKEQIPIGISSGASRTLCKDRIVVIVRKDGTAHIIKAKNLTRESIFRGLDSEPERIAVLAPRARYMVELEKH